MSEGLATEEFGPYLVYEQLGMGGMAEVHRAVAKGSDVRRPVALKRMLAHIASNEEMVKSFVLEARVASYLRHQNVPQTYELGKVGGHANAAPSSGNAAPAHTTPGLAPPVPAAPVFPAATPPPPIHVAPFATPHPQAPTSAPPPSYAPAPSAVMQGDFAHGGQRRRR